MAFRSISPAGSTFPIFARTTLFVAAACVPLQASAQWGGGGFGYNRGGFASTAQQAAAYGMSEMMRAQGSQNLENSQAAINWEQAKTQEIQNRLRWTETYFEMRKVNREAQAAERGPPVTKEQAMRMARDNAPRRLVSTELDPVTGHIGYPPVLMDEPYVDYRARLDKLFAQRAASGGSMAYSDFRAIQTTVTDFIDSLKSRVKDYPASDYGRARTFLDSLAHEARMPAG